MKLLECFGLGFKLSCTASIWKEMKTLFILQCVASFNYSADLWQPPELPSLCLAAVAAVIISWSYTYADQFLFPQEFLMAVVSHECGSSFLLMP